MTGPQSERHEQHFQEAAELTWEDLRPLVCGLINGSQSLRSVMNEAVGEHALGPRGALVLMLISSGVRSPMDLASELRVGRSLITFELTRLTASGLVLLETVHSDRRRVLISLTPAGSSLVANLARKVSQFFENGFADYPAIQTKLLSRVISGLL